MLIAIEGCCHGELDKIYETLEFISKEQGKKIDLLICCGDFQAVRNVYDLSCMAVPPKYLTMQTFYKYYSGEKQAPVPTIFIGGNHEASNHLQELCYGGWVAPNIFYLGNAGVVNFGGLRIAGISGIYKGHDYLKGHFEVPPFGEDSKRSIYHVRQLEVFRLKQISRPLDIFLSHDWPAGVTEYGDVQGLLRFKPFFREEIEKGQLGNPCTWDLLQKLQPRYWFSAHLHAKFSATIPHKGENNCETKFLALDKCLPGKRFLQILEITPQGEGTASDLEFRWDPEWLGILKDTNHLWHFDPTIHYLPGPGGNERHDFTQSDGDIQGTMDLLGQNLKIEVDSFQRVAPLHESTFGEGNLQQILFQMEQKAFPRPPVKAYVNPQTTWLCEKFGIVDPLVELMKKRAEKVETEKSVLEAAAIVEQGTNPEEISMDDSLNEGQNEIDDAEKECDLSSSEPVNGTSASNPCVTGISESEPIQVDDDVTEPIQKKLKSTENEEN